MVKLKIDLFNGTVDVEGGEQFVKSIYEEFKEKIGKTYVPTQGKKNEGEGPTKILAQSQATVSKGEKPKKTTRSDSFEIVNSIDGSKLKQFFSEKKPKSKYECNAVFVYFLQKTANLTPINMNHIYTCYKLVNLKVPKALRQSLADTSFHKEFINTKNMEDIKITIIGENMVEHDLPKIE